MKKLFNLLVVFLASMMLVGCAREAPVKLLEDTKFNGTFVYSRYWEDDNGLEEVNEYYSYDFDGTNECTYYYDYKNYRKLTGWSVGKDLRDYKIEINDSKTYFRLNDVFLEEWEDWKKYEFLDNGNTLRIWDFPEKFPDSYRDFYKK